MLVPDLIKKLTRGLNNQLIKDLSDMKYFLNVEVKLIHVDTAFFALFVTVYFQPEWNESTSEELVALILTEAISEFFGTPTTFFYEKKQYYLSSGKIQNNHEEKTKEIRNDKTLKSQKIKKFAFDLSLSCCEIDK